MSKPRAQATQQGLDQCVDRRGFLKSGVLAGASAAVLTGTAAGLKAAPPSSDEHSPIPARPFGKTGWKLPILAMGGSAMVKQFISAYGVKLLSTDERVAMVRHAYERGIRYFDTARLYGESESIIGKALKDVS